jgi:hypothetical protein
VATPALFVPPGGSHLTACRRVANRSGALSESQVAGFESRIEVHEFLKKTGIPVDYVESDLEHDIEAHTRLGILPAA